MSININSLINDGTVKWMIVDIRDTAPVGAIGQFFVAPSGWLKLNGAELNKEEYPRLISYINTNNLWGNTDGLFKEGSTDTKFIVPNFTNRFLESRNTGGTLTAAGLPNITGTFDEAIMSTQGFCSARGTGTGVFSSTRNIANQSYYAFQYASSLHGTYPYGITFNAASNNSIYGNSTTVQPLSVSVVTCIKY